MHSGRVKRSHEHSRSQSRPQGPQDLKTVGEYALHHLLTSLIAEADNRIERCIPRPGEPEPRIEGICGPGADPAFDQLISSTAHINRQKPNALINAVIHWRKKKADAANQLTSELQQLRESVSLTQRSTAAGYSQATGPVVGKDIVLKQHEVSIADSRSTISIYILCRMLIEIIKQTTLEALNGPDGSLNTVGRLEDVIYGQIQNAEPDALSTSRVLYANWEIRGQLMGEMSGMRFQEVCEKYTKDLERAQQKLSVKGLTDAKLASKTALLVKSMRWLKVRCEPDEVWAQVCRTLNTLAHFFAEVHGRVMKYAYAELFEQLMLPIAATATSELNMPKWKDLVDTLQRKLSQMLTKADHWPHVYPLQAVLLCVSPIDQFASQWPNLINGVQPRNRERPGRSHVLKAVCRLVWRYLYRCSEPQAAVMKKLDDVVKLVFQGGKRVLISTDLVIADPLIQLIRIIGYKYRDFCFRNIIFPLMNSDIFSGQDHNLRIENLDPEKTVIAIRAFLAIMSDIEKHEAPSFPTRFECDTLSHTATGSSAFHRRSRSQGLAVSAGRTERLSRPVITAHMDVITMEYYVRFCKILGQLTIICDNTFGGQAVLDEKFASHTPKTPMAEAFNFTKREDIANPTDLRQHYYDMLHVAVEALPRCLSPHLPINSIVNLLCTGTAHVQQHIANSSAQALKSIARQSHAQQVTIGFARFIFNFDDRYSTVSDGSLLGPGHIESTLKLYVELLQIWIDDIQLRSRQAKGEHSEDGSESLRGIALDLSSVLAHVDEIESHGLFFLCSPSRAVRAIAVNVLRLITKFDTALGKPSVRIISILEGSSQQVIDVNDERLSLAERSRLQKGLRKSNVNSTLVELCSSDVAHDAKLWFKLFPNLVRLSSEICIHAVALTRELVCQRLSHSSRTIAAVAEGHRLVQHSAVEQAFGPARAPSRVAMSAPDIIIEQWKIHLIFACTTLTNIGGSSSSFLPVFSQGSQHTRKSSKSSSTSAEKIASASELFSKVVPFLDAPNPAVRSAAASGLGAANATIFQSLLESLQSLVRECNIEAKERLHPHQRMMSAPRRNRKTDILRTEITHLLSLTCHLLNDPQVAGDQYVLSYMVDYAKHVRLFLSDTDVQDQLDFQKLRTHFCTLMECLYDSVCKLKDSTRWLSFQSRQATFALMEDWCGFSPHEPQLRKQEDDIRRSLLEHEPDRRSRGIINSTMEKEKIELQTAALSAMAALSAGPLNFVADNKILMQFDVRRMLAWVASIFDSPSDKVHAIGRRALQNLIVTNTDQPYLMAQTLRMCYIARAPKALTSYFEVVTTVLTNNVNVTVPFWKILCAGLYTLGNEDSNIRMKSIRLLRALEEGQSKTSKLQDLDISVSDKTTAVYKLAQFEVSRRLAKQHPELAFHVFSEFSAYFNELLPDHQRNMVSGMLPWIQAIELQLDPNGGPTATSYMLLVNMFEITAKSSIALHNEIQALWQALATGPYAGNVQLVLDFIIQMCLDRKEHNFVVYAKQIVVFLSKTPAGARVIEYLLLKINPRSMVAERREPVQPPADTAGLPHIADLALVLPAGAKQNGLSLGQLSMILLVDLIVSPVELPPEKVPTLLQVVMVQWDQYASIVQDQAREMLVHLIHELVISKIEPGITHPDKKAIEDFIEAIRCQDPKIMWSYADSDLKAGEESSRSVSEPMTYVINEVVKIFLVTYPALCEDWGRVTMKWATSCAVRHIACRSFQVFRCIYSSIDQQMLADMLARLSNTIAEHENPGYLVFSLEILATIRSIIARLTRLDLLAYPQLFWTTCACLDTIFEPEFQEGMTMLSLLLKKMDLSDPAVLKILRDSRPANWEGGFDGLHALFYKGMRSSQSMERALDVMEQLMKLPSSDIVGHDERLLFTLLANLPRYLQSFEEGSERVGAALSASVLSSAAQGQGHLELSQALNKLPVAESAKSFLSEVVKSIRTAFFPALEFRSLVFLLGMVNNQTNWFKIQTMHILCVVIPDVDMRKPEIASQGPDLISPLLRLLPTEHCQQALAVLDNVMEMTGTPLDNKHLRMSMAGSHSSRATRKEYESIKSLYGIPEASGWSIPMPAQHALQTRSNVHSVFYTLAYAGLGGVQEEIATPDIEFHHDEFGFDSYFAERDGTMTTDDTRADGNMGELAEKLEDLDDFFDEPSDGPSPSLGTVRHSGGDPDSREQLYDEQALPILHQSLRRQTSVTSFNGGFVTSEARYPLARGAPPMTPGAFAQSAYPTQRPRLHNRSITTPAPFRRSPPRLQNDIRSGDEAGDEPEPFSDDDLTMSRSNTGEEPPPMQHDVKPAGRWKQGLRRLTSSGGNRQETLKNTTSVANKSPPRVPKVPTWATDPSSAEP